MNMFQALGVSLSSPTGIAITIIEFLLGFGAGYVLFKGLKYIVAFFLILIVGDLLSVWKISALNFKSLAAGVASGNTTELAEGLRSLAPFLGIIEPLFTSIIIFVGFLIGAAVAFFK